jgi:2-polyprenyl-3-methyl-5-hydroxy-6-metoxy-1,4-benzoquinol methylase
LNWWDLAYISGFTPWDTASPPAELEDLLERGLLKPCRALDIGCGTGGLVVYLAKRGFEVTGIDISIIAVKRAILCGFPENWLRENCLYKILYGFKPGRMRMK